VTEVLYKAVLK